MDKAEYRRKYYQEHKEELKAAAKKYRESHKEQYRENQRKWQQSHREQCRASNQKSHQKNKDQRHEYYLKNREKILKKAHERYHNNKESILVQVHEYRAENPDKPCEAAHKYYHSHKQEVLRKASEAYHSRPEKQKHKREYTNYYRHTPKGHAVMQQARYKRYAAMNGNNSEDLTDLILEIRSSEVTCHICGQKLHGKDCHIDHIIPLSKGGSHTSDNIAPACPKCNIEKGNKILDGNRHQFKIIRTWLKNRRLADWIT